MPSDDSKSIPPRLPLSSDLPPYHEVLRRRAARRELDPEIFAMETADYQDRDKAVRGPLDAIPRPKPVKAGATNIIPFPARSCSSSRSPA